MNLANNLYDTRLYSFFCFCFIVIKLICQKLHPKNRNLKQWEKTFVSGLATSFTSHLQFMGMFRQKTLQIAYVLDPEYRLMTNLSIRPLSVKINKKHQIGTPEVIVPYMIRN